MRTAGQAEHEETVGVVPEVAARLHEANVFDTLDATLAEAGLSLRDLDAIAVTAEPGLMPSLLVGLTVARTLAHELGVPLLRINHIHAHILANYLDRDDAEIVYPLVCLTASGGHNELYLLSDPFSKTILGRTRDDAAGEAFDKVAKMLGLGYPGGPVVSRYSREYSGAYRGIFPESLRGEDTLDFSFSGLKSAVRREIEIREGSGELSDLDVCEICHEFEMRAVETLVGRTVEAARRHGARTILLAGGVSANDRLVTRMTEEAGKLGINMLAPAKKIYSTDNAAMIGITAALAYECHAGVPPQDRVIGTDGV
jgi:N6-L-threonylcarbamoyladenine synthase